MKSFEKTESLRNPETENYYQKLFELIKETDIAVGNEKEWSSERLENVLADAFKKAGEEAIRDNKGKIFMTISGGLDSTLALAILRKKIPEAEIITFTMGGSEKHPDIEYGRLAAEKFKAIHQEIIPRPEEIQEAIAQYHEKFPEADLKEASKTGDIDVHLLYKKILEYPDVKTVIAHDGIDELMGGYWPHRQAKAAQEKKDVFVDFWQRLIPEHLSPLIKTASSFDIRLIFPYLDGETVKAISQIPLEDRVSQGEGKKPLREIAKRLDVPEEIINRPKKGQLDMLETNV